MVFHHCTINKTDGLFHKTPPTLLMLTYSVTDEAALTLFSWTFLILKHLNMREHLTFLRQIALLYFPSMHIAGKIVFNEKMFGNIQEKQELHHVKSTLGLGKNQS